MAQMFAIYIGDIGSPTFSFDNDSITGISENNSVDLIGRELCTDIIEITVNYTETTDELRTLEWATPIYFYSDGQFEGKYYLTDVTRIGVSAFRIRGTSAVGILEYETFYGGIYSGATFADVAREIIGTNGMMPYSGYYTKFTRIISGESPTIGTAPIYLGMSAYQDLRSSGAGNGAFNTATMSSKMSAKVQIHPFHGDDSDGNIRCMVPIIGAVENINSGTIPDISVVRHRYGLYMDVRRNSTSVPWPDYGDVRFTYESNDYPLGTPTSEADAVYEIDVDPVAGTVTINGNTESFSSPHYPNDLCPLHSILGVSLLYSSNSGLYHSNMIAQTQCDITVEKYEIRSQTDELQFKGVMLKDLYTGGLCGFDLVNKIFNKGNQVTNYQTTLDLSSFEQYDTTVYGDYPAFRSQTDLQIDILASMAFSPTIESMPIYGWLPICNKREALHQLMMAYGVILVKDESGNFLFTVPISSQIGSIDEDRIYNTGSSSKLEHVNTIEVTEHSFVHDPTATAKTVFTSAAGSNGLYIANFNNAPIYGTPTASGITVICSNCNAALVSGMGTLTAVCYLHDKQIITQDVANYPDGKTVTVSDATLVTVQNSASVMERLEAYYANAVEETISIELDGERCGLYYGAFNAFDEAISGFIASASKVVSSVIKATCKIISGYVPPDFNGYKTYEILTGSGTWTVPDGVEKIKVILIGGGRGGESGLAGKDGEKPTRGSYSTTKANGGYGGEAGAGGRVYEIEIDSPSASYTYNCGNGGVGGNITTSKSTKNQGTDGTDTVFTDGVDSYSSGNGTVKADGIVNLFTGEIYARRFEAGTSGDNTYSQRGRRGGAGGYFIGDSSETYYYTTWPGSGTELVLPPYTWYDGGGYGSRKEATGGFGALGGCGGGAAAGSPGNKGANATLSSGTYHGGKGGNGGDATAVPPKATTYNPRYYGYGGCGGYGGGGGGSGGLASSGVSSSTGSGGTGGYGGKGGDGGDGCVLIYY